MINLGRQPPGGKTSFFTALVVGDVLLLCLMPKAELAEQLPPEHLLAQDCVPMLLELFSFWGRWCLCL